MEVLETGVIGPCHVTLFMVKMRSQDDFMAEGFQELDAGLKFRFKDGAGRGNDADFRTLSELSGFGWDQRTFLFVPIENDHQALKGQKLFDMLDALGLFIYEGCKAPGGNDSQIMS